VISRSTGTASTSSARTPTGPLGLSQADEIHSADVSESAESSSEKLIQDLNARASIFDPSWIFYLFALAIAAVGSVLSIPAPLPLPPLPDVTKPLSTERKGNLNDEYATLLARYGEPTSILFKDQAGVPVRVIQYQPAGTAIALVPNGCVAAYEEEQSPAPKAPRTHSRLRKPQKRRKLACVPLNTGSTIVAFSDSENNESLPAEFARTRIDKIQSKRIAQPSVQVESELQNTVKSRRSPQPSAPERLFDPAQRLSEELRLEEANTHATHREYSGAGLLICSLTIFVGAFHFHNKIANKRTSRFFYELGEEAQQRYSIVQQALKHLSAAQSIWRIESTISTSDLKRNAGAATLMRRNLVHVSTSNPPRVETNIAVPCIELGLCKLFFLPDIVLYWQTGRFGAIAYDDLRVEQYTTQFVEEGRVPVDTLVVGKTWRYVNKDGGPDRRFNNNAPLPIVKYGALLLTSSQRLNIHLQISNSQASQAFSNCFDELHGRDKGGKQQCPKNDPDSRKEVASDTPSAQEGFALKTLGLKAGCSLMEISAAHRRLAQLYHPDKVSTLGPELRELADVRMRELNAAYDFLKHESYTSQSRRR
jgi:hypothetical protein